jgi:hypothetical protein
MRLLFSGLVVAAIAALAPTLASAGQKQTLSASHGDVKAAVTFKGSFLFARAVRITITRGDTVVLDRVRVRDAGTGMPTASAPSLVAVTDLDGDGEPEVLLDLYSGGAHCCWFTRIYHFGGAYTDYTWTEHGWGNYPYDLVDLDGDGLPEFSSADDRFAYAFAAYAFSIPPIQIWQYRSGLMSDVTRSYRTDIKRDARTWWRLYKKERRKSIEKRSDLRAILAAWAADKYQLGHKVQVWKTLKAARKRGELRGDAPWPKGRKYLRELRAFLVATGYAG